MWLLGSLGSMMDEGHAITSYIFGFHFLFHFEMVCVCVRRCLDWQGFIRLILKYVFKIQTFTEQLFFIWSPQFQMQINVIDFPFSAFVSNFMWTCKTTIHAHVHIKWINDFYPNIKVEGNEVDSVVYTKLKGKELSLVFNVQRSNVVIPIVNTIQNTTNCMNKTINWWINTHLHWHTYFPGMIVD